MPSSAEMVSNAIHLIKYRWHVPILNALGARPQRYTSLLAVTARGTQINSTALDNALVYLLASDVVSRNGDRVPVYHLTQSGQDLLEALQPLGSWAEHYRYVPRMELLVDLRSVVGRSARNRPATPGPADDRHEPPATPSDPLR